METWVPWGQGSESSWISSPESWLMGGGVPFQSLCQLTCVLFGSYWKLSWLGIPKHHHRIEKPPPILSKQHRIPKSAPWGSAKAKDHSPGFGIRSSPAPLLPHLRQSARILHISVSLPAKWGSSYLCRFLWEPHEINQRTYSAQYLAHNSFSRYFLLPSQMGKELKPSGWNVSEFEVPGVCQGQSQWSSSERGE